MYKTVHLWANIRDHLYFISLKGRQSKFTLKIFGGNFSNWDRGGVCVYYYLCICMCLCICAFCVCWWVFVNVNMCACECVYSSVCVCVCVCVWVCVCECVCESVCVCVCVWVSSAIGEVTPYEKGMQSKQLETQDLPLAEYSQVTGTKPGLLDNIYHNTLTVWQYVLQLVHIFPSLVRRCKSILRTCT